MTSRALSTSPGKLKAIETVYHGHKLMSRQDSRFSVLLNALAEPYRYELEGYYIGNGEKYLPDFWLEEAKIWIEIKGMVPEAGEFSKAVKLALIGEHPVAIFWGSYHYQSFIDNNYVFYKDDNNVFHSERSQSLPFLSWQFRVQRKLLVALTKARRARFEFGESG